MQISLRSHLIAGTAAVVATGAIMAPMTQGHLTLPALNSQVNLTALAGPLNQLLQTAQMAVDYETGVYYAGGDSPTPGAGEANWPYAGMDQTGGETLNYLLYQQTALGYYSYVGQIPQNILNASPVLRQLETNVAGYINTGLSGLIGAGLALTDLPTAVVTAAQLFLAGQISAAITALFTPAQNAIASLVGAGTYIASSIVARLGAVFAALPQIATTFAGAVAGTAALTAAKIASVSQAVISNLVALNFEGAWNAAVTGWLGPSGLPGQTLNLTLGAGIQTGPIVNPATDIPTNFVPSIRTASQAAVWTLADALATAPVGAAAAVAPAAARTARSALSAPRAAAAAAKAKAPGAARAVRAAK